MFDLKNTLTLPQIDQLAANLAETTPKFLHTKPKLRILKDFVAVSLGYTSYAEADRLLESDEAYVRPLAKFILQLKSSLDHIVDNGEAFMDNSRSFSLMDAMLKIANMDDEEADEHEDEIEAMMDKVVLETGSQSLGGRSYNVRELSQVTENEDGSWSVMSTTGEHCKLELVPWNWRELQG